MGLGSNLLKPALNPKSPIPPKVQTKLKRGCSGSNAPCLAHVPVKALRYFGVRGSAFVLRGWVSCSGVRVSCLAVPVSGSGYYRGRGRQVKGRPLA